MMGDPGTGTAVHTQLHSRGCSTDVPTQGWPVQSGHALQSWLHERRATLTTIQYEHDNQPVGTRYL